MNSRRLWALASLLLFAAAIGAAVDGAVRGFPRGLTVLACVVLAVLAAWYGVRRRGAARRAAAVVAAALVAGAIALVVLEGRLIGDLVVIACFVAGLAAARAAFEVYVRLPRATPPRHPVMFYNPLSGDGKAKRFHLADEARRRGIEAIELHHGDDLEQLVRQAVGDGADGLAMAGGDGSQAVVAMVAAELDLPYACIPAGTRNHFALDLGVDRDDVAGALDAFVSGGERRVDLGDVNGRVFVNNVSLGLYAEAVETKGYREAKIRTLLATVPDVLGPDAEPPHLSWRGPSGRESGAAILVSNNVYRLGRALGSGTRPRLDRGVLGIAVFAPSDGRGARSGVGGMQQWSGESFQVDSDGPVAAGIDGESMKLDPPVRFSIRPGALRARIAAQHPGASPSTLEPDSPWQTLGALARFAFGPQLEAPSADTATEAGTAR